MGVKTARKRLLRGGERGLWLLVIMCRGVKVLMIFG